MEEVAVIIVGAGRSGIATSAGEYMHASQFSNGRKYSGKDVLVVGSGNSGMEISYDLCRSNARTAIVNRSPVHVVTKEMVFPSTANIDGKKIEFMNGESNQFDAIIFATGYRSTVGRWLKGGEELFDHDNGFPKQNLVNKWKGSNGFYCVGFARNGLLAISNDAKNVSQEISMHYDSETVKIIEKYYVRGTTSEPYPHGILTCF